MPDQLLLEMFLKKLEGTSFKIYKEEAPLVGQPYTIMHIESVFDVLELIMEFAAIYDHKETFNLALLLKLDIMKSIGREEEK